MWFSTGIAQALADNHRVVAIDHLNHGESDRPEPEPRGVGRVSDVLELMDLLGVGRAHIHGYSMGGAMVSTLLYEVPEKFITAGYGGSGVRETDPVLRALAASFDDPEAEDPSTIVRAAIAPQAEAPAGGRGGGPGGGLSSFARPLDLTTVDIPVIAINGELDSPYGKTMRMWRELEVFENVVLPGLNHFTAIAVGEPMPQRYVDSMVGFIDKYDEM
jgi:pimeloyl-ACP methyl ester carboxylesterase